MAPLRYSDEELVCRAVVGCRNTQTHELPRWAVVKSIFKLGSTSAALLCRRFMLDPDEELPGQEENEDG